MINKTEDSGLKVSFESFDMDFVFQIHDMLSNPVLFVFILTTVILLLRVCMGFVLLFFSSIFKFYSTIANEECFRN